MREFIQSIIHRIKTFNKQQTDEYKVNQVMKVVDMYGSYIRMLGDEFYIMPERARCYIRYKSDVGMIVGSMELDVVNEYQFKFAEEKFNKHLKHRLNKKNVRVDFCLNKMYI